MMKLAVCVAALLCTLSSAQTPPCPATPANYCVCGIGDSHARWLCRSNNGYTWNTNDIAPKSPCPTKYPLCTLHREQLHNKPINEFTAMFHPNPFALAPTPVSCLHAIDNTDHKCTQSCGAKAFKMTGLKAKGACPATFTTVDKTTNVEICTDGVTSLKYCPEDQKINVTVITKGMVGACYHHVDQIDHKCFEACADADFKTKGIDQSGPCSTEYGTIDRTVTVEQCQDGVTSIKYCQGKTINVTITTKGEGRSVPLAAMAMAAPSKLIMHEEQSNHCTELEVDLSKDSSLDQVKAWWSAHSYDYTSAQGWLKGPCEAKFNVVGHVDHPIGVSGVTFSDKGQGGAEEIWASFVSTAPRPCKHQVDVDDHKCFEACADGDFEAKGITQDGKCPGEYNTVDKTVTVQQCPDGVTSIRYCPDTMLNVTVQTKGEAELVQPL